MRWSQGYLQVFRDYGARLLRGIFRGSFSCFDMSMAIMPAFVLSTVSILVNLTLGVVGALAGDNLLVAFESVGQMLLNMYLTLLVLGGITTVTEWNQIRTSSVKKFVYVFTFPPVHVHLHSHFFGGFLLQAPVEAHRAPGLRSASAEP